MESRQWNWLNPHHAITCNEQWVKLAHLHLHIHFTSYLLLIMANDLRSLSLSLSLSHSLLPCTHITHGLLKAQRTSHPAPSVAACVVEQSESGEKERKIFTFPSDLGAHVIRFHFVEEKKREKKSQVESSSTSKVHQWTISERRREENEENWTNII